MLNSFSIAVLAGIILGYMAGLGIGGGSLLILWLTLMLRIEQPTARAINLMFFLAAAGAVSIFRWKQKTLQISAVLPAIITGTISAAILSYISTKLDIAVLQKLFGLLLLVTGVKELLYRPRNAK